MPPKIDMVGKRFGRLVIIKEADYYIRNRPAWVCRCDCGSIATLPGAAVRFGNTRSCGCLHDEIRRSLTYKHGGRRRDRQHPLYNTWQHMRQRCHDPKSPSYQWYGAKGITVCDRWMSFECFLEDMEESFFEHVQEYGKSNTSLDRKENDKGYSPDNCRWATWTEQSNNTSNNINLTFNGKTQSVAKWSRELNINYQTLIMRVTRGWDVARVLTVPVRKVSCE